MKCKFAKAFARMTKKNKKTLEGTTVEVFNENSDIVHEGITDENGQITTNELPQGKYTVKEATSEESLPRDEKGNDKTTPLWKRFVRLFAYATAVLAVLCFARPGVSVTSSMTPTVASPCVCLTAPIYGYIKYEPQRFDVISVKISKEQGKQLKKPEKTQLCKRVIGLGGETVEIKDGLVYINGELLEEKYLPTDYVPQGNFGPFDVPEGHIFVLGDNREHSIDSRYLSEPYFPYDSVASIAWLCVGRDTHIIR